MRYYSKRSHNWRTDPGIDPNKRTKLFLEELGYRCKIVEFFDGMMRVKRDFFGCADVLAMQDGFKILIQATVLSEHEKRKRKIERLINWQTTAGMSVNERTDAELLCEWLISDQLWIISWKDPTEQCREYMPKLEPMLLPRQQPEDFPYLKRDAAVPPKIASKNTVARG